MWLLYQTYRNRNTTCALGVKNTRYLIKYIKTQYEFIKIWRLSNTSVCMYFVKYIYLYDFVYSTHYYWQDISECAGRCQTDKSLKPSGHAEEWAPRRDYTTVNIFQPFEARSCYFLKFFFSYLKDVPPPWVNACIHAQCGTKTSRWNNR
jgi:hypothetical protein